MLDKDIGRVVNTVLEIRNVHCAVKYFSEKEVISATRRIYNGKIDRRDKSVEILVKIGKPNYIQCEFIKKCKKVGEPFPVKKIQIKYIPKKK